MTTIAPSSCDAARLDLTLFVHAELPAETMGRIGLHVGACIRCQDDARDIQKILDLASLSPPPSFSVDIERVIARAGAGAPRGASNLDSASKHGRVFLAAILALAAILPWFAIQETHEVHAPPAVEIHEIDEPLPLAPVPGIVAKRSEADREADREAAERKAAQASARARMLLDFAAAAPALNAREMHARIAATGVDVTDFLRESGRTRPRAPARAAFEILRVIAPELALEAAAETLAARDDLDDECMNILRASKSARAESIMDRIWSHVDEAQLASAIAARGNARAARVIAERARLQLAAGANATNLINALVAMGKPAADSAARLIASAKGEDRIALIEAAARASSPVARNLVRDELRRPQAAFRAAVALAGVGDGAGLAVLIERIEADAAQTQASQQARAALEQLAQRAPAAITARIFEFESAESPALAALAAAIAADERAAVAIVSRLAATRGKEEVALAVAASIKSAPAIVALRPLGDSRRFAAAAVTLANALDRDRRRALVAFLSTRYGADPARAALADTLAARTAPDS